MSISWTQENFETMAQDFNSWTDFLSKYPQAQTIAKRGKIDPWKIFTKGGGRVEDPEAKYTLEYWIEFQIRDNEFFPREAYENPEHEFHEQAMYTPREQLRCAIKIRDKRMNMTDAEVVTLTHEKTWLFAGSPEYLAEIDRRKIPHFLVHPLVARIIKQAQQSSL